MGNQTLDAMRSSIRVNTRDAFDIGVKTFSDSELRGYINDGIQFVAATDPAAYRPVVEVQVPADSLTVSLGADQLEFVEILRNNLSAAMKEKFGFTTVGGRDPVQMMSARTMACAHASSPRRRTAVVHACSLAKDGKTITIWPINTGAGRLNCRVRCTPPAIEDSPTAVTVLPAMYDLAVVLYATYRALARDSEDADALSVAEAYAKEAVAILQSDVTAEAQA